MVVSASAESAKLHASVLQSLLHLSNEYAVVAVSFNKQLQVKASCDRSAMPDI